MRLFLLALPILLCGSTFALADVNVAVSIRPLHSLVASVMQGVADPTLILNGNSSPHTYTLTPVDAEKLQGADVVFWIGHELETFLEKPLDTLSESAVKVALMDAPTVTTLPLREDEGRQTQDHDHDAHQRDAHIWLDPDNAKAMLGVISDTLSKTDPDNADIYKFNAEKSALAIDGLVLSMSNTLEPARGKDFIIFHDAYQYFERRFGLKSVGSISVHPENPPGAKQIAAIQKAILDGKVKCVFAEPQFDSKLVKVVIENTNAKTATLDPIGVDLVPGPNLYGQLLQNLANSFASCMLGN